MKIFEKFCSFSNEIGKIEQTFSGSFSGPLAAAPEVVGVGAS